MVLGIILVVFVVVGTIFFIKRKSKQKVCKKCGKKLPASSAEILEIIRCVPSLDRSFCDVQVRVTCPSCKNVRVMSITVTTPLNPSERDIIQCVTNWFNQ